ncbi:MAG: acetyl/propionyl/methylcrotonyl-CoA carboxylase subunit alpha [Brevundimonas sp.]|uniref:acetyl/propionyl/methylcrotonyl-CoA carboxylase subunit alpha n=1 Tax=Brevundimonas sp. TaxID=1871086 RepID=UPI00391BE7BF
MFKSVLVANRGEIACRVFRTARAMGIRTLAVYSEADAAALHVRMADEATLIGPAPARESYLDQDRVLAAARAMGAEAIHPGYGFLSENAEFAEAVAKAGLVWIGPAPASIRAMGLKDAAKDLMDKAGVPVTPGYLGADQSDERLISEAGRIGYPVLVKAVAGGGGKGMKRVDAPADFAAALASARREAGAAFGDERVLLETYITRPRHIEVQVFGDAHGNIVHLYERDCSLQRRHQKVIEEAPAPGMDAATRKAVTDAAVRAARAVDYVGAGTVEFIADASEGLRADRIWFMEMNTRLQVEHPVTEAVTGVDLVEWQFRVAAGEPIPMAQDDIPLSGHAMEARLYAEDPARNFLPSIGRLHHFQLPDEMQGVRVDTGFAEHSEVSQFYDPMLAKIIVHRNDRGQAAEALAQACAEVEVAPVRTNAGFLVRCLRHPRFVAGDVDTAFIGAEAEALASPGLSPDAAAAAVWALGAPGFERTDEWASPWEGTTGVAGLRLNQPGVRTRRIYVADQAVDASLEGDDDLDFSFVSTGDGLVIFEAGEAWPVSLFPPTGASGAASSDGSLRAPMPGKVVATPAAAGDHVVAGQPVVVVEAMKMEHALSAPFDGMVAEISVGVGDQVGEGTVLAVVSKDQSE